MLEETSRIDEGIIGKCLNVILYKTLADRLWGPFKAICFNPVIVLAATIIIYIVFMIIFLPLLVCSYLVTSYGSFLILLLLVNYLVQVLARAIAFPGCNVSVQKQLSAEFINRILVYLENIATLTSDLTATLMLVDNGRLPPSELQSADRRLAEIVMMAASLPKMHTSLQAAVTALAKSRQTTPEEQVVLNQLCAAVEGFNVALPQLAAASPAFFSPRNTNRQPYKGANAGSNNSTASSSISTAKSNPSLVAAGHCLKACELLKAATSAAQPVRKTDDESSSGSGNVLNKLKGLLSMTEGLKGVEKVTFPYMRELLKSRFGAHRFSLAGSSGNTIDAMLIPASLGQQPQNSSFSAESGTQPTTPPPSAKGLVMFCSPNAGFYECVSQAELQQSWLGFYSALGYDVCFFNYAGYGSSTGAPSPHGVKQDALILARHLRKERQPAAFIVHGESIGGLAACFVARSCQVDLLVCDRTFASLDALATRLLGAMFVGYGLKYLGLWSTHVVGDFLACECPKLVLQVGAKLFTYRSSC